jgi:hypothetical protein
VKILIKKEKKMKRFFELWKITPADCRGRLIVEFILFPADFNRRYAEEMTFKTMLQNRWS